MMYKKKKGFTLVELLVTITLLSLILILIFSLFFFENNSFAMGQKQSDVQYDLTMISNFIDGQVKYCSSLEILDNSSMTTIINNNSFNPVKKYIFIDSTGKIKFYSGGVQQNITGTESAGNLTLVFTSDSSGKKLGYNIITTKYGRNYNISSSIFLQNMTSENISGANPGAAIVFGPLDDQESVTNDSNSLDLSALNGGISLDSVKMPLFLPIAGSNDTTISWATSNPDVIKDDGVVIRPLYGEGNQSVTLTATITKYGTSKIKYFYVTVLQSDNINFTAATPPDAKVNRNYSSYTFQAQHADGSSAIFSYKIINGTCCLTLSGDGILSGKPDTTGTDTFTVQAVDQYNNRAIVNCTLNVIN